MTTPALFFRNAARMYLDDYSRGGGTTLPHPDTLKEDLHKAYTEHQTMIYELTSPQQETILLSYIWGKSLLAVGLLAFGEFDR